MLKYDARTGEYVPCGPPMPGEKIELLYGRLSQEDANEGDSGSILNQRDFLFKYAQEHGFKNPRFIFDDGYSGTNFDRPGFQEMMGYIEAGIVTTVIVKDHSRLGRNRLVVGALMERFTEDYGVRYIAVTDGIDSQRGLDDMVAVRELFNEFYPRDTSKKIRAVFKNKGESGQRLCTQVLYGYVGDKYKWDIDPEAAAVVKEIFDLAISGLGPMQIAKRLTAEGHLNPTTYRLSKGRKSNIPAPTDPTRWESSTIVNILGHMEYTGCTVNFKTRKKSYKSKKTIQLPKEEWRIFPDTHPAIIDQEQFDRVQELRQHRRRPTKTGRQGLFSGVAFCADCGARLYFAACKSFERRQEHYRCANYKSNTGSCTAHFIREDVLRELVTTHLRQTLAFARDREADFLQAVTDKDAAQRKKAQAAMGQELKQGQRRMAELDALFRRIYEDMVAGKLTEERFNKLSSGYEAEQAALAPKLDELAARLEQDEEKADGAERFLKLVRRYTEIEELTPEIVNEFIARIEVHAPDKSSGHRQQRVDIFYNYIGRFDPPQGKDETAIPTLHLDTFHSVA